MRAQTKRRKSLSKLTTIHRWRRKNKILTMNQTKDRASLAQTPKANQAKLTTMILSGSSWTLRIWVQTMATRRICLPSWECPLEIRRHKLKSTKRKRRNRNDVMGVKGVK